VTRGRLCLKSGCSVCADGHTHEVKIGPRKSVEEALKSGLDRLTPRVVAVAFFEDRVLLTRRGNTEWELPGGRAIRGERNRACLVRWFGEHLGVEIVVGGPMGLAGFAGTTGWTSFVAYGCRLSSDDGLRVPNGCEDASLFRLAEIDALQLADTYRDYIGRWTPEIAAGGLPTKPPRQ
jgi:ADP-ribose pyrophosphatase YjhB (NUDIX family)